MNAPRAHGGSCALALTVALAAVPVDGVRAQWRFAAGVGTEVYAFSERRDGAEDVDGAIAGVQPFVGALRLGSRFSFGAEADLTYRRSLDSGEDDVEPGARLDAAAILVERALRFDVGIASRLRDTSPIGAALTVDADAGLDPVGDADPVRAVNDARFARVDSLELGPTLTARIGDRSRLDAAYRFGIDRTDDENVPDGSRRHSLNAATRTWLDGRSRTALRLSAQADRAEADDGVEATALAGVATIVHAFSPKLGASVSLGRDRISADALPSDAVGDDGDADADDIDESGTVYGASVAWRPTRRVAALVSWTQRSYGGSPAASLSVTGRRSAVRLGWTRTLAIDAGVDLGTDLVADLGGTTLQGGPGANDASDIDAGEDDVTQADDAGVVLGDAGVGRGATLFARDLATVDERVTLDYTVLGRLTTFGVGLAHVRRESIEEENDASTSGTSLTFGIARALGRRATLAFDARYAIDDDGRGAELVDDGLPAADDRLRRTRVGLALNVLLR